jgi:hypothetical protein
VKPREILIPKLIFSDQERKLWSTKKGVIFKDEILNITNETCRERVEKYFAGPKIALISKGDRIKYVHLVENDRFV